MAEQRVRTPGVVHVIGLTWTSLLLLWTIVLPPLDGPDEVASLDLVIDATDTSPLAWQVPFTDPVDPRLRVAAERLSGEEGLGITRQVGSWADLLVAPPAGSPGATAGATAGPSVATANPRSADPPLAHRLLGYGLAITPDWRTTQLDVVVRWLRVVSLLALVPLPWLLARIAAVLNGRESVIVASAAGALTFPRLAIQATTVGPGAVLVLLSAVLLLLLGRIATGGARLREQRAAGVVITAAALAHPYGLALLVGLLGALAVRRRSGASASQLTELAGAVLLPVLSVGWWYGVNSAQLGSLQPGRSATALLPDVLGQLVTGTWGRVGGLADGPVIDVPLAIAGGMTVLLLLASVGAVRGRGLGAGLLLGGPAVAGVGAVLAMRPAAGGLPLDGPDAGLSTAEQLAGLAGEGVLIGLPGVLVLVAVGLQRGLPGRLRAWGWAPPLAAGLVMHGILLSRLLVDRWAAGEVTVADGLTRIVGRSPVGVEALAGIVLGLAFGLFVVVVQLVGVSRRLVIVDPAGPPAPPEEE